MKRTVTASRDIRVSRARALHLPVAGCGFKGEAAEVDLACPRGAVLPGQKGEPIGPGFCTHALRQCAGDLLVDSIAIVDFEPIPCGYEVCVSESGTDDFCIAAAPADGPGIRPSIASVGGVNIACCVVKWFIHKEAFLGGGRDRSEAGAEPQFVPFSGLHRIAPDAVLDRHCVEGESSTIC